VEKNYNVGLLISGCIGNVLDRRSFIRHNYAAMLATGFLHVHETIIVLIFCLGHVAALIKHLCVAYSAYKSHNVKSATKMYAE